ncbi:endonuclease/exonuclease/phosphatase family protein [Amaricoccus sp.]|uniref:endonuclease/exonuclease/phosphatase family protein n=1 Tax=Amaricoccus sp. TaxID=1872485 RepID=UPI001B5F037C|nr:endonuclease/exonuclease/phosphatase family protein [Amaricoccus sp.]MBP7000255.1 endonuclease/exonuclease/phosphatase family protein [Amaricoccus sp.]
MGWLSLVLVLLGLSALLGCAAANRFYVPPAVEPVAVQRAGAAPLPFSSRLTLSTWNVGYAGMGRESDFVFDLGRQKRPLSASLVDKNLAGILEQVRKFDSDIILLQEGADPSWVNYRRDVIGAIAAALPGYSYIYSADVDTRGVPPPWNVRVGNATFSRISLSSAERRGLPLEPTFQLGVFRKSYRMLVARIGDGREWVIINIHLSTFDSAEDDVRRAQATALLAFAEAQYRAGRYVVIGGDWNLRLARNDFPNTTEERFKFWIRDFPSDLTPEGWSWAVDPMIPTVRTAYQPYVAGENYTLNIDGFLVSPNVRIESVAGLDLDFEFSDHQPVTAAVAMR